MINPHPRTAVHVETDIAPSEARTRGNIIAGEALLVAGQVTVTVPGLRSAAVDGPRAWAVVKQAIGATIGAQLEVNVTADDTITIRSLSTGNAVVATDTSYVSWFVIT